MQRPEFEIEKKPEDDQGLDRLLRRFRENPVLPIGITAFLGIVMIGAYRFRTTKTRPSLFLIQLRVAAQGTIIGIFTLGAFHQFYTKELRPREKPN